MPPKTASEEFEFLRTKLESVARLLVKHSEADLIEAGFMIGCLHSICHQNSLDFKVNEPVNG